jgi:hypothetical protein
MFMASGWWLKRVCDPPALLDVVLGVGLERVNPVGELHAVTDGHLYPGEV